MLMDGKDKLKCLVWAIAATTEATELHKSAFIFLEKIRVDVYILQNILITGKKIT